MIREALRAAKRSEPFQPFRVVATTGMVFDICYRDHFMVGVRSVILGIPDPFRREMLDRTFEFDHDQIVSIEPLPFPSAQANGSK